jgi:hypothetical protein
MKKKMESDVNIMFSLFTNESKEMNFSDFIAAMIEMNKEVDRELIKLAFKSISNGKDYISKE